MDDFLIFVEALVNGKDWYAFVQIPHTKYSRTIMESLCYGGLWQVFEHLAQDITVEEVEAPLQVSGRRMRGHHCVVKVQGLKHPTTGARINDLLIAVQMPGFKEAKPVDVVAGMVEHGLGYYLGQTVKKVYFKSAGETQAGALENNKVILC